MNLKMIIMEIFNYLGHEFKLISQSLTRTNAYICIKCKCEIDHFLSGKIVFWRKNGRYSEILEISCNEYLIKNIIE